MTTQFYAPPSSIRGQRVILDGDEAKHIARSLRKQPGDVVYVVDGNGHRFEVKLDHVKPKQVVGNIRKTTENAGEPPYHLTVAIGLLKNRNRFETFLEKAVECGVSSVVPLETDRTEVQSLREQRASNILTAAMKQSGRSVRPDLTEPMSIAQIVETRRAGTDECWICHEAADAEPLSAGVNASPVTPGKRPRLLVFIGPEGGFTESEVRAARDAGAEPVRLGPHRLRTETAGIVAASAISLAYAAANPMDRASFL
ncbi:RsmE family RNA methyltransferase [Longibacter sp.]|uniref:RsmE family RNA methyltransferase n=1 Tax=Longibacter sp. TaxID=2045415 RepID=UPI003EB97BEA